MTRARVSLLVSNLWIGGAGGGIGRFALELARALDPARFAVGLYALWDFQTASEQALNESLRAAGIATHPAAAWDAAHPYASFGAAVQALRATFAAAPADILHSHHEFGDLAALWLRRPARARAVLRTVHNREWRRRPLRRALLTNGLYPLAFQAEAAVSQDIVNQLNQRPLARLLRRRARLLHNAVNLDRFRNRSLDRSAVRRELGVPDDAWLVGSVGRLVPQKGYACFLEAAALARRAQPRLHFALIGDGELESSLRQKAIDLGLADHLTFAGARADVDRLLLALDLFVSSSLWEGLPTVILESMAAGLPVVATDIPGTRELLVDGQSARLVPPADAPALSAGILELLADGALRRRLADQAARAAERFSIQSVAAEHEQLYCSLLAG